MSPKPHKVSKSVGNLNRAGRKAGTPNKLTASAKEAFQLAFTGIGGAPALTTWARENQTEFYKLFARLIPAEVTSDPDAPLTLRVTFDALK